MTNKKLNYPAIAKEAVILTGAVAIIAAAVYFFLVPSHTSVSSISGLGIVLSNFVPLPLSAITMVLNIVLLIIGFFTCGREFGAKTVYTSVMLPVFLGLFERLFPDFGSMTDSQELDVLCYILVVSVGLSILFNRNASSGGLDIVAKIMNKYLLQWHRAGSFHLRQQHQAPGVHHYREGRGTAAVHHQRPAQRCHHVRGHRCIQL